MYTVGDFQKTLDEIAPFSSAESWDNAGLLVGSAKTKVKSALVALDASPAVIAEAKLLGANLIITHHPVIFPSLKSIDTQSPVYALIAANISVLSAHTNYDAAGGGVNDTLAAILGLKNMRPLESASLTGLGRVGELEKPLLPADLAAYVKDKLAAGGIKHTEGVPVQTVAVCGGACAELWRDAQKAGAAALVTAEAKHHQLIEAGAAGFTLIDAGHFATESPAMRPLVAALLQKLPNAAVALSKAQADPAKYL